MGGETLYLFIFLVVSFEFRAPALLRTIQYGGPKMGNEASSSGARANDPLVGVFSHVVDMNPTKTEVSPTNMHQTALNAMK